MATLRSIRISAYLIAAIFVLSVTAGSMMACGQPDDIGEPDEVGELWSDDEECLRYPECVDMRMDWFRSAVLPCSLAVENYVDSWGPDFTPFWITELEDRFDSVYTAYRRDYDSVHYSGAFGLIAQNRWGELLYQSYDCYYDPLNRKVLKVRSVFAGMVRLEEKDELLEQYAPHLRRSDAIS